MAEERGKGGNGARGGETTHALGERFEVPGVSHGASSLVEDDATDELRGK
jgi:hypothetical protein